MCYRFISQNAKQLKAYTNELANLAYGESTQDSVYEMRKNTAQEALDAGIGMIFWGRRGG